MSEYEKIINEIKSGLTDDKEKEGKYLMDENDKITQNLDNMLKTLMDNLNYKNDGNNLKNEIIEEQQKTKKLKWRKILWIMNI